MWRVIRHRQCVWEWREREGRLEDNEIDIEILIELVMSEQIE